MSQPTVNRRDIRLEEEIDETAAYLTQITYRWTATLNGPLSTGENVEMARHGSTSTEALAELEEALAQEGWSIA